jgi:hypothetical protein
VRWPALLVAVAVLAAAPAQAVAGAPLPGRAKGVRVVNVHGRLGFVFTRQADGLWKRIAGREVSVECEDVIPITPGTSGDVATSVTLRAPTRGRRLVTRQRTRVHDVCRISLVRRGGAEIEVLDIALDQRGATLLDEVQKADVMVDIYGVANSLSKAGHYPPASEVVATVTQEVVELTDPGDTPARGAYGVYSDANQHVEIVAQSSAGRRLFLDFTGDVFSSNVFTAIEFHTDP